MNLLITGGLLALALVALVGAVLLGMGEERAEKQRKAAQTAQIPQALEAPRAARATNELAPAILDAPASTTVNSFRTTRELAPALTTSYDYPVQQNGHLPTPDAQEEAAIALLTDQLQTLNEELSALVLRVSELEQRLNMYGDALENLDYPQNEMTARIPAARLKGTD